MSNNLPPVQAKELPAIPDEELVVRAQAGDARSFEQLVRRHGDRTYRLARYLCRGHAEDAEDTFQNALIKAHQHLAGFRGEAQFSTWLHRIAVNECLLHRRRQGRERDWVQLDERVQGEETSTARDLADSAKDAEEEFARREFQAVLQRCLGGLPELDRSAFVLRDIQDLSIRDIAARLGLSVAATKSRVFRARLVVRRCLRKSFCRGDRCYWPGSAMGLDPRTQERKGEKPCSL